MPASTLEKVIQFVPILSLQHNICSSVVITVTNEFYHCLSVVIHHFSTKARRIRAIREMARTLQHGGQMMIYVWAMEQKYRRFEKQDIFVPWNRSLCSRPSSESSQNNNQENVKTEGKDLIKAVQNQTSVMLPLRQDEHTILPYRSDNQTLLENCCPRMSKDQEYRLYKNLGKSLRSWFFSKSFDDVMMQTHIERLKSMKNSPDLVHTWSNSTVNMQPVGKLSTSSRHCSLEADCPSLVKRDSLDEEVFSENPRHEETQWLETKNALKEKDGRLQSEIHRPDLNPCWTNSAGDSLKETLSSESTRSAIESIKTVALDDKQETIPDATEFMRYYHVFREGELVQLIEENVQELHILSFCYDHGNWCVIVEKQ